MRRSKGFGRTALMMACAVVFGVALIGISINANAEGIPTKVGLMKPLKLFKLVSKPTAAGLPTCNESGVPTGGGLITVTQGGNTLTCSLAEANWDMKDTGGWNKLGKCETGKFKGYKYLNKGANDGTPGVDDGNPCKVILIKSNVIKIVAKGSGSLEAGAPPNDPISLTMDIGDYSYEALWDVYDKETEGKLLKAKDRPAPVCDCTGGTRLSFETGIPTGQPAAGTLSNYRCDINNSIACVDDGDCNIGPCYLTPPLCQDLATACTQDSDCVGTCAEVVAGNLPLDLEVGSLYTGGGLNSVPLPLPVPDQGKAYTNVTTGDGQTLTLTETTPAEVGALNCTQGRKCSGGSEPGTDCVLDADCAGGGTCVDNCVYGPPLPIPNAGTPATSVCSKNVVGVDATGTAQCDGGDSDLNIGLRSVVYLNGDLFTSSSPPDLPGVQPCPLCVPICSGGSNNGLPCRSDNPLAGTSELSDCTGGGGTCPSTSECLGGPNDGAACTPETSDPYALGDDQDSYPTSQDCQNDPLQDITANIGGLPIALTMTTGTTELNAEDRAQGQRTFCGFCRDVTGAGSLAFEGDTSGGLPAAIPPADGNGVPCTSDADCVDGDEYESCVQRNPGAFSEAAATRISVTGSSSGCLGDNNPHAGTLVSIFCIPPTFDATVDAAGDLPGPGGTLLFGEAQLN